MPEIQNPLPVFQPSQWESREVNIGGIPLGGNNPVRIQSMTNTSTLDTERTVEQAIRIINAGADYVRFAAPSQKDAENLFNIKKELRIRGYNTPLIADIHFNPNIAELAAQIVEKVRINPGNFIINKSINSGYSDIIYKKELDFIRKRFIPLLNICKSYRTAIRIGVNHGSLCQRIIQRYGKTIHGMVESALEYLRICIDEKFLDVVVSMKTSSTRNMIDAYFLLIARMIQEGMNFPLHIGITEAGWGIDGRIKSAVGIASMLIHGIGDTIRVSLTEPPENEIPVAKKIIKYSEDIKNNNKYWLFSDECTSFGSKEDATGKIFNLKTPVVIIDAPFVQKNKSKNIKKSQIDKLKFISPFRKPDFIYTGNQNQSSCLTNDMHIICNYKSWNFNLPKTYPLFKISEYNITKVKSDLLNFIFLHEKDFNKNEIKKITKKNTVIVIELDNPTDIAGIIPVNRDYAVIIKKEYSENDSEIFVLKSACDFGAIFLNGFADGLWLTNKGNLELKFILQTAFGILQASEVRYTKAELISCPTCGRTLFDFTKEITDISNKTAHLANLKIAVMGCIVNGPGEMSDADYGCIISGRNRFTIYKAKKIIKKNIHKDKITDELIKIIKEYGDWKEP